MGKRIHLISEVRRRRDNWAKLYERRYRAWSHNKMSMAGLITCSRFGAGRVESADKVIEEAWLKGAGMQGPRHNVNPMLVLRNAVGNRRGQETWSASWTRRRARVATQRQERSQHRLTRACGTLAAVTVRLQHMACPPAPALTVTAASAPGQKPATRLDSGYSWRNLF